jgi:hypothetical protein
MAPIIEAVRRRDTAALAPGTPFDLREAGVLGARMFRLNLLLECRIAVVRAAAAVRAYQLEQGRPPSTLAEAAVEGLEGIVTDPFDGGPLLYEVHGTGWRVASRVWPPRPDPADPAGVERKKAEVIFPRPARAR